MKLAFGSAHVFYTEDMPERCTAALLLDIDPLKLVRGPGAVLTDYRGTGGPRAASGPYGNVR